MAITRYTMTMQLEFSTAEDRDAAYAKAKTWATNEKTGGKIASCQMQKGEYTKPEMSTETI